MFQLGWGLWVLGISEETGSFCLGRACVSWTGLGWIVMKIWFSIREISFWGNLYIMGGLLDFHSEERMGGVREVQS